MGLFRELVVGIEKKKATPPGLLTCNIVSCPYPPFKLTFFILCVAHIVYLPMTYILCNSLNTHNVLV